MLHSLKQSARAAWASLLASSIWSVWALAQDQTMTGGTTQTTTRTTEVWYGQWWLWAVGVAVFLIVVIALTNRGGRSSA